MYACGVYRKGIVANYMGGIYLWQGNANGGWGSDGDGAMNGTEYFGQKRGRWFVTLPFGVVALDAPTAQASYGGRLYLTGGYSHNLVLDEHHRLWKQGMRPPEELPQFASGGGTGDLIAYFSWYDEFTGERSPLSLGTPISIPLGSSRQWINLPTRPPDDVYESDDIVDLDGIGGGFNSNLWWIDDTQSVGGRVGMMRPGDEIDLLDATNRRFSQAFFMYPLCFDRMNDWTTMIPTDSPIDVKTVTRATHLELWLQPAADFPRLALRVARGTQTVTEATALGDLGEAFISSFQRLPRSTVGAIYHDRQIVAGDPENPDTVYLSQLYYPERWDGLAFQTKSGEPITGILSTRDYCLVFTRNATYMLQGYTDTDYTFQLIDQSLGAVGHNCNVVIHGNPFVWTEKGPYMYNGTYHPLSPENRWVPPSGAAVDITNPRPAGPDMEATDDPHYNTYLVSNVVAAQGIESPYLESPQQTDLDMLFHAVLDYTLVQPETGGALRPARLSFDRRIQTGEEVHEQIKYLRTRWGAGALYHIGYNPGDIGTWNDPYGEPTTWNTPSFFILAMKTSSDAGGALGAQMNIDTRGRIITPFYYFDEPGGFAFEAKKFSRLWFHGTFRLSTDGFESYDWRIRVYAGPDSGFWNKVLDGTATYDIEWEYESPSWEISRYIGNAGLSGGDQDVQLLGDIITPPLPTAMQGRGLWLDIDMGVRQGWFEGFGGEILPGSIVEPYKYTQEG